MTAASVRVHHGKVVDVICDAHRFCVEARLLHCFKTDVTHAFEQVFFKVEDPLKRHRGFHASCAEEEVG